MLLAGLVEAGRRRNVVELGAGWSSRVLARTLSLAGGGRLTSVDQSAEWSREAWDAVVMTPAVDARLVVAAPQVRVCREGIYNVYAASLPELKARGPYDMVFIDGPQWYYGRDGGLPLVYDLLQPGALILLDDAGRPQERWALRRWLQTFPGLELLAYHSQFGRKGVALLRHTGDKTRRRTPWPWISGGIHLTTNWLTRVVRGLPPKAP
jgi:hypothetical protein